MKVKISSANSVQELSEKLNGICQINKIKGKNMMLTYNNKQYSIKRNEESDNEFDVSLAIPMGLHMLGAALGVVLSFVTGLTGFIPIFAFVGGMLLIITAIYTSANEKQLSRFVAVVRSGDLQGGGDSEKEVVTDREKIRNQVIAVIRKKINRPQVVNPIDETTVFQSLGDMLDLVETQMGLEEELGFKFQCTDELGPATAYINSLNEATFGAKPVSIGLIVDSVIEEINGWETPKAEKTTNDGNSKFEWSVNSGTLTIKGQGEMPSYDNYADYPWSNLKNEVTKIVIERGISSIGEEAFQLFIKVKEVSIADSVTTIGRLAFGYCKELEDIAIPDSVTSLGKRAFVYCASLQAFGIPKSVDFIGPDLLDMSLCKPKLEYIIAQWETPVSLAHFETSETVGPVMSTVLLVPRGCSEKYREAGWQWMPVVEYDKQDFSNLVKSGMNTYLTCRVLHGYDIKRKRGDYQ
jgi:acyl carrier protein